MASQLCKIDIKGDKKEEWMRLPKAESSVTQHHLSAGGKGFDYTATAGTLIVRDDEDKPIASIGYVAYTRKDVKGARPITFAFNGGPGSSSLWLHMGVLGPRRVVVSDPTPTPAGPYRTVRQRVRRPRQERPRHDRPGRHRPESHAVCDHKDEEFWGVDPDIDSVSRFIAQYVSDNKRWTSPKYLLGESYGTTRAAAIVNYLRARRSLAFNGLILVSVATDIEAIFAELPGNDRPVRGLPARLRRRRLVPQDGAEPAGRARAVPQRGARLRDGPVHGGAAQGRRLDVTPSAMRWPRRCTSTRGCPADYLKEANLRVSENAFAHELLRAQRKTVGRLDGRFVGPTWDPLQKDADYDPQSAAISAAYAATFLDYYHGDLKFGQGRDLPHDQLRRSASTGSGPTRPRTAMQPDRQHRRRPGRGALQGREPQGAGAQRLLRPRDAVLGDRVRDDAPRPAPRTCARVSA